MKLKTQGKKLVAYSTSALKRIIMQFNKEILQKDGDRPYVYGYGVLYAVRDESRLTVPHRNRLLTFIRCHRMVKHR